MECGILFDDVNNPVKWRKIKALGTYPCGKLSGQNGYGLCCGDRIDIWNVELTGLLNRVITMRKMMTHVD